MGKKVVKGVTDNGGTELKATNVLIKGSNCVNNEETKYIIFP
jgi:archaellum component FlaF (FlaF/FlaG flagellin family)